MFAEAHITDNPDIVEADSTSDHRGMCVYSLTGPTLPVSSSEREAVALLSHHFVCYNSQACYSVVQQARAFWRVDRHNFPHSFSNGLC